MDSKLAAVLVMALQDFDARAGDDAARLRARDAIGVFTRAFHDLLARTREDEAFVEQWMRDPSIVGDGERGPGDDG